MSAHCQKTLTARPYHLCSFPMCFFWADRVFWQWAVNQVARPYHHLCLVDPGKNSESRRLLSPCQWWACVQTTREGLPECEGAVTIFAGFQDHHDRAFRSPATRVSTGASLTRAIVRQRAPWRDSQSECMRVWSAAGNYSPKLYPASIPARKHWHV
jgi:hypothetical protein